jgi:autotransporter strand-loop-strand O-heptosyltransferase
MKLKIYAHGSYIGNTGYNSHTREFYRELSKLCRLKVRNYTIGETWKGYNQTPHDNEPYFNEVDRSILYKQILWNNDNTRSDFDIYKDVSKDFIQDLNLVLCETDHYIFYDEYQGPKIAYNVWESTLQPENFFNQLKKFDEVWVPSKWQKECMIKQGFDENKIQIVPEGVDIDIFYPDDNLTCKYTDDGRFKFFLAGRWDYRKSTKEIIETFLKTFHKNEPIDLIISVDNPFSNDNVKTTEERLSKYGLVDERIKIIHFPERQDYIKILKTSHCFVSCARSEGWNLPLIEAMACGIPSIYSNCSGQLEFAQNKGIPVNVLGEKPANESYYNHFNESVGNYYEPNFDELSEKMRFVYENYKVIKKKSLYESFQIRSIFNWKNVAKIGFEKLMLFSEKVPLYNPKPNTINLSFIDGPRVEILGDYKENYFVEFIDSRSGNVLHSSNISNNMWTACSIKYFVPWIIKINGVVFHEFNLKEKEVIISLESKSLGDTIGWAPYIVDFAKKHSCKVIFSSFHNNFFEGLEDYKDIKFITPGTSHTCYALYRIGWFKKDNTWIDFDRYPNRVNTIPLQQTSSDILGLEYKELNYGLNLPILKRPIKEKYVVFGPNATAGCKEWSYENWVTLSELFNKINYKVVTLTSKEFKIKNTINIWGESFQVVANYLHHAEHFIGLGSGLSWLNWALGKHTYMINGFSRPEHEGRSNTTQIYRPDTCIFCWNDTVYTFDSGDWDWCPVYKGTEKQHICQIGISPLDVFSKIQNLLPTTS